MVMVEVGEMMDGRVPPTDETTIPFLALVVRPSILGDILPFLVRSNLFLGILGPIIRMFGWSFRFVGRLAGIFFTRFFFALASLFGGLFVLVFWFRNLYRTLRFGWMMSLLVGRMTRVMGRRLASHPIRFGAGMVCGMDLRSRSVRRSFMTAASLSAAAFAAFTNEVRGRQHPDQCDQHDRKGTETSHAASSRSTSASLVSAARFVLNRLLRSRNSRLENGTGRGQPESRSYSNRSAQSSSLIPAVEKCLAPG